MTAFNFKAIYLHSCAHRHTQASPVDSLEQNALTTLTAIGLCQYKAFYCHTEAQATACAPPSSSRDLRNRPTG